MKLICNRLHQGVSLVALASLCVSAGAAQAQDADADEEVASASEGTSTESEEGNQILVTGSRIRGIEAVGSNVIALDQDDIQAEPVISTNDLLRRVPQVVSLGANRAGGSSQNGAANATRGAGINLRGISTNATLLLYDGRRFPPQGTQGQFTDPSVIPSLALGRVEVVADGASAIYGSDAVAGVVNLILRRDMDGIEARFRYGFTDGDYSEKQAAVIAGQQWGSGGAMVAFEYTENEPLFGSEVADWYQQDNRSRGGRDLRNTNCARHDHSRGTNLCHSGGRSYSRYVRFARRRNAQLVLLRQRRPFDLEPGALQRRRCLRSAVGPGALFRGRLLFGAEG